MTQGFRAQVERLSKAIPGGADGDKRRAAIGSWAAMIGAVILARAIDDPELSDEVLGETRAWINAGLEPVAAAAGEGLGRIPSERGRRRIRRLQPATILAAILNFKDLD